MEKDVYNKHYTVESKKKSGWKAQLEATYVPYHFALGYITAIKEFNPSCSIRIIDAESKEVVKDFSVNASSK
jgi:hypothetical protein